MKDNKLKPGSIATKFKTITYELDKQRKYTYELKTINDFVLANMKGKTLNVFAGTSKHGITNDLDPTKETDYTMEAVEFLKQYKDNSIDTVLFDPPFTMELHKLYYKHGQKGKMYGAWIWEVKKEIARVLKVGGVCIHSGYETNGIGAIKGFEKDKLLIVAHGGLLRDTFTYTEVKIESGKHYNTWRDK